MYESTMTSTSTHQPLVMRWVPVRDARGRTVMESCWVSAADVAVPTAAAEVTHTHAA